MDAEWLWLAGVAAVVFHVVLLVGAFAGEGRLMPAVAQCCPPSDLGRASCGWHLGDPLERCSKRVDDRAARLRGVGDVLDMVISV